MSTNSNENAYYEQLLSMPDASLNTLRHEYFARGASGDLPYATDVDLSSKADKNAVVYRALDYGAVGDGVTDDRAAINDLIRYVSLSGGGTVLLNHTDAGYGVSEYIRLRDNVKLCGDAPGVTVFPLVSITRLIQCYNSPSNIEVYNINFDGKGLVQSYIFEITAITSNLVIRNCLFTDIASGGPIAIEFRDGANNIFIDNCSFYNFYTAIRINRDPVGVKIANCRIIDWFDRAIWILGTDTTHATNLDIVSNTIYPHSSLAQSSNVRQPIQITGYAASPHYNVKIINNAVIGTGTDHEDPDNPGSADLISLHHTDCFVVAGNTAIDGGDVGITVSRECKNGAVTGNIVMRADSAGICIGSGTSIEVHNITVTGNTSVNNGQDRYGPITPDRARCGVLVNKGTNIVCSGNIVSDDQVTKTQVYGFSFSDSANVYVSGNLGDNATSMYLMEGTGNTNIIKATTEAVV